jgi:hypothetical protein
MGSNSPVVEQYYQPTFDPTNPDSFNLVEATCTCGCKPAV